MFQCWSFRCFATLLRYRLVTPKHWRLKKKAEALNHWKTCVEAFPPFAEWKNFDVAYIRFCKRTFTFEKFSEKVFPSCRIAGTRICEWLRLDCVTKAISVTRKKKDQPEPHTFGLKFELFSCNLVLREWIIIFWCQSNFTLENCDVSIFAGHSLKACVNFGHNNGNRTTEIENSATRRFGV